MARSKTSVRDTGIIIDAAKPYDELMPDLVGMTKDIKASCEDYVLMDVPSANITMEDTDIVSFASLPGITQSFSTTELSMSQLCDKLGMPIGYYRKLCSSENFSEEKQALAKDNIERLAACYKFKKARGLMMRTYKDKLRAVLSNSYSVFDSDQISRITDDCIRKGSAANHIDIDDLVIGSYICDYEQFGIRVLHTEPIHIDQDKQKMYCGLGVTSSDVGKARLRLGFYIYETIDGESVYLPEDPFAKEKLFSQIHFKTDPAEIRDGLLEAVTRFPKMKENIRQYLNYATAQDLTNSGLYNPKSYNGRHLFKELELSENEAQEFLKIAEQRPKTLKDYVMALGRYAKEFKYNPEKRRSLEEMAGKILLHPDRYGIRKRSA